MISIQESTPSKSQAYLFGQDIFWEQFNEINFYVEDEEQEQFYLQVFNKLFKNIKIDKIFPLRGKVNVIEEAKNNLKNKKNVYVVDKDFDDLLGKIENLPNLFYLKHYEIENYLFEEQAIWEYIIDEKPRLKHAQIKCSINVTKFHNFCIQQLAEIFILFIIVQEHLIPIENTCNPPARFLNRRKQYEVSISQYEQYKSKVLEAIHRHNITINLEKEITKYKKKFKVKETDKYIIWHISGKYLAFMFLRKVNKVFSIKKSSTQESFCYRLAKNCTFTSLDYLKSDILKYIN